MASTLILTHSDFDGWLAGAIACVALQARGETVELRHVHYGDTCPIEAAAGRDVYVLDFSWPAELMLALQASAKLLIWLDHHPGSVSSELQIYGARATDRCAAWLVWRHFHPWEPTPEIVAHCDDHDRWIHAYPKTRLIAAAVEAQAPRAGGALWERWPALLAGDQAERARTLAEGQLLVDAQEGRVALLKHRAVPVTLDGRQALAVNATSDVNELADALEGAEVAWIWSISVRDGQPVVTNSLRSRKGGVDVGQIAKGRGGGGHRSAAGWVDGTLAEAEILRALGIAPGAER
jgi:hypothetical protein